MPKIYYNSLSPIMVLIDDCDNFIRTVNSIKELAANKIIENAINVGITFIGTVQSNNLKGYDEITKIFKETINAIVLGNPNDQSIVNGTYMRNPKTSIDLAYNYNRGQMRLIKIPKIPNKTNLILKIKKEE